MRETGQCCPDIELLPKLADLFGVSIDALFGREAKAEPKAALPWPDDETLRVVLYVGHKQITSEPLDGDVHFCYEGPALNITSALAVNCENVEGDVTAGTDVSCGDVAGRVNAGTDVNCGDVQGDVTAGTDVSCGDVAGDVNAGTDVSCGDVQGNVQAGSDVNCGNVEGSVSAGGDVTCDEVAGRVVAGGSVNHDDVKIDVQSEGDDNHQVTVHITGRNSNSAEGRSLRDISDLLGKMFK